MNPINFSTSIDACTANSTSLLEDAELLASFERPSTALAIAVLAQEEAAKAFMLALVQADVLPWVPSVRRALNNHECKHLIIVIMEWLAPPWEEAWERLRAALGQPPLELAPAEVAHAINILRHEKVERFRTGYAHEEPEWSGFARRIAGGLRDREKQRALYVTVGDSGSLGSVPRQVKTEAAGLEIGRAKRLLQCAEDVRHERLLSRREFQFTKEVVKAVFEDLSLSMSNREDR
jgi:AbiV family abortive infection protein